MSFPTIGQQSAAYALNFTAEGIKIGAVLFVFTTGAFLGALIYEDLGSPDTATVQAFATEAVNKAEGKAVTPPTTNL